MDTKYRELAELIGENLDELLAVIAHGASKHTFRAWTQSSKAEHIQHMLKHAENPLEKDPDSGQLNLIHVAIRALMAAKCLY